MKNRDVVNSFDSDTCTVMFYSNGRDRQATHEAKNTRNIQE